MTRILLDKYKNMKLFYKLILICSSSLMVFFVITSLLIKHTINVYNQTLYSDACESLNSISDNIDYSLQSIAYDSKHMAIDTTVQSSLSKEYPSLSAKDRSSVLNSLETIIYSYLGLNSYIDSISIITNDFSIIRGRSSVTENQDYISEILSKCDSNFGKECWFLSKANPGTILIARPIKKIQNLDLSTLGFIVFRVNIQKITNQFMDKYDNADLFVYDDDNNEIIYSITGQSDDKQIILTTVQKDDYSITTINGYTTFNVSRNLASPRWTLFLSLDYNDFFSAIRSSHVLLVIGMITILVVLIFISAIVCWELSRHFKNLSIKIKSLSSGCLEPVNVNYDYSTRNDELGIMHKEFDDMLITFKRLMQENDQKQKLINEANLKALEQQINPHFLYNTLDVVYWKAQSKNENDIAQTIKSLANLLRYAINNEDILVCISKEVDFTHDYLRIQKYRYGDRLQYTEKIDEKTFNTKIPKMSIQPIIENAIKYGLEKDIEPCKIDLQISTENNMCFVSISNTLSTIPEDILTRLERGEQKAQGNGIGLLNIQKRLQLIFGPSYGLSVSSNQETTIVTIKFPMIERGEHIEGVGR